MLGGICALSLTLSSVKYTFCTFSRWTEVHHWKETFVYGETQYAPNSIWINDKYRRVMSILILGHIIQFVLGIKSCLVTTLIDIFVYVLYGFHWVTWLNLNMCQDRTGLYSTTHQLSKSIPLIFVVKLPSLGDLCDIENSHICNLRVRVISLIMVRMKINIFNKKVRMSHSFNDRVRVIFAIGTVYHAQTV